MKRKIIFAAILILLTSAFSYAEHRDANHARKVVRGWLKQMRNKPLNIQMGQVAKIDTFAGIDGRPLYHVVYINPSGFIIVPADDEIEPVIGFSSAGQYDPSPDNPMGALVSSDMENRAAMIQREKHNLKKSKHKRFLKARSKWQNFESLAETDSPLPMGHIDVLSDVRVNPLILSKWSQSAECSNYTYNYYTPNNYVCGCTATAMAQIMRFYQYPLAPSSLGPFTIYVNGVPESRSLRGGDGLGGNYSWSNMALDPDCSTTLVQRQAIGALTYDAGVAAHMQYSSSSSGAWIDDAKIAFVNVFSYSNAIDGGDYHSNSNIGPGLYGMLNPNLDAGLPCLLGIHGEAGHAIVCDGYGYSSSTLYHHLNMGWAGNYDTWYNLPDIDAGYIFDTVSKCIYNLYLTGSGEIISGRVTTLSGAPISGASVTAYRTGGGTYETITNSAGIYAFAQVPSYSSYEICVNKDGYTFVPEYAITGTSADLDLISGNVWGIDFVSSVSPPVAEDGSFITQINTAKTIALLATDDGLPNPPGALNYKITGLAAHGTLRDPQATTITSVPYTLVNRGSQVIYTPATGYHGPDDFQFKANDGGTFPQGGDSIEANISLEVGPIFVNAAATGANNGRTWNDAYTSLQSAITAAVSGSEIWVVEGTYKPTTGTSRTASFVLKNGVAIYGGFDGTETNRQQRDWTANQTILSGDIGTVGSISDNSYHVVTGTTGGTIDGFRITKGNANNQTSPNYVGGGMLNNNKSPNIVNCTFTGNTAAYGGGMYNATASPTIVNCVFAGNSAVKVKTMKGLGGGMYNKTNTVNITNCTFVGNSATNGGGVYNTTSAHSRITNCTFSQNSATYGGGMDNSSSTPIIKNSILWANTASGGPQIRGSATVTYSDVQGGWTGTGNINTNPNFILIPGAPGSGNFGDLRLQSSSPCIDVALNSNVPADSTDLDQDGDIVEQIPFDLAGDARIADGNGDDQQIIDMGAYEYFVLPIETYAITASASAGGSIIPGGTFTKSYGENQLFTAVPNQGFVVAKWYVNADLVQNGGLTYNLVNIQQDSNVHVDFVQGVTMAMAVTPPGTGFTLPAIGSGVVPSNTPLPISAHADVDYGFAVWTAVPPENVLFENAASAATTATLTGNATITANFNSHPVADINASATILNLDVADTITLDASGSTDDGLPNPPGALSYNWQKIVGPDTCVITNPDNVVTDVVFTAAGMYRFMLTVSDGSLYNTQTVNVSVLLNATYVSPSGNDVTGDGTPENPFATIGRGITYVSQYGRVIVMPGTYHENLCFNGKNLTLSSQNPDDINIVNATIINGDGAGPVITLDSDEDSNTLITGFTITNGSMDSGGGIFILCSSPRIEKNIIVGNTAYYEGGGIYCREDHAQIRYNIITQNYAPTGGAIGLFDSFAVLQNNLIYLNDADFDPAIWCTGGQPAIVNNTIADNSVFYDSASSALYISSSLSPIVYNNIIAYNYGAPAIFNAGGLSAGQFRYNDVYSNPFGNYAGISDQTGINGNISVDPDFVNQGSDYHLSAGSLCIDAGDPLSDYSNEPQPNGGRINLGNYGNTSEATCSQ